MKEKRFEKHETKRRGDKFSDFRFGKFRLGNLSFVWREWGWGRVLEFQFRGPREEKQNFENKTKLETSTMFNAWGDIFDFESYRRFSTFLSRVSTINAQIINRSRGLLVSKALFFKFFTALMKKVVGFCNLN